MVTRHLRMSVLILLGIFCRAGHSAALPDLIARIEKLAAQNTLALAVHVKDQRARTEENEGVKPVEEGDFNISADAKTLTVSTVGDISDTRVFQEFSLLRAHVLAHCAPQLVRDLAGLKLIANRPIAFQGDSCQHWRLRSEEKQSQFGVKTTTVRDVELWVDTQGYPLQALFKTQVKGRMLLFKFSSESTRQQRYKRVGGRLVLVFDESKTDTKSKAGAEKRTVTTTVTVTKS